MIGHRPLSRGRALPGLRRRGRRACHVAWGTLLRQLFQVLPYSVSCALVRNRGGWARFFPSGHEFLFDSYLTDLRVIIDTRYPIEREMLSGVYDPSTLAVIDKFVRSGDCCLDVGANVGAITLALAKRVAPGGKVFAFEPGPVQYQRLQGNLKLNPALRDVVELLNMGLSDRAGSLRWIEDSQNPGNAGCLGVSSGEPVPGTTIDTFFHIHPPRSLRFVKIDVEGMEYEVIKGGLETWRTYQPVLYYETQKGFEALRGMPLFSRIETMLRNIGYGLYRLDADGMVRKTGGAELADNTIALPEAKAPALLRGC